MAVVVLIVVAVGVILGAQRYGGLPDDLRAARQAAREASNQAKAITPANLDRPRLERLATSLDELETRLAPLRDVLMDDPLVGAAKAMPVVGKQLAAAGSLVAASDALIEAGDHGLGLAERVVDLREAHDADADVSLMPGLVELMATSGAEVDQIGELVALAGSELAEIPDDALGAVLEARDLVLEPLDTYTPLLDAYREYDDVLPGLLGWGEEKRYLVLAQNPAELRPSGGYAGTVGVIALKDGSIVEQRFQDVHELSRMPGLPFVEPPDELATYLLGEDQSWRLADANWSPDFPTSARTALEFYGIESGDEDIDGVIAITTYALDRLLEVVGPVEVPQHGVTVEPGDTTLTLLGATRGTPKSVEGRKEVLDVLARRLTSRLLALPPARWASTLEAMTDIGTEQLALAWFPDAAAQELVEAAGWSGAVRQDAGDYLSVVESNVAPTSKYNLVIDRTDSLIVKLDAEGDAINSLRLDWDNRAGEPGEPYASLREFSTNKEGWYGAYVRTLVPREAELVTVSGQALEEVRGLERQGTEAGRASLANFLLMPPGPSTLSYLWTSPGVAVETAAGWVYDLVIQKQPGARPVPVSVRIDLPAGATVVESSPGLEVDGERLRGELILDQDLELRVVYQLP